MKFLYSNIPPLRTKENQVTIKDCIIKNFELSDSVEIAVGYISEASLDELETLVDEYNIGNVCLIMGMYFFEGISEKTLLKSIKLNENWKNRRIGEIRIVTNFKYHGKIFSFQNQDYKSTIIGSSNLSVIKPDASTRRQYESAIFFDNPIECDEVIRFINQLKLPQISKNINEVEVPIKKHDYEFLKDIELVSKVSSIALNDVLNNFSDISFNLPLKVPPFEGRFSNKRSYCTKSNLNVCYSSPRNSSASNPKPRDWFETQITVNKTILEDENWPKDSNFFIITDDGYQFKAHTSGQNNKQLSAKGNELILGWWIKGRLVNAGLVSPQPNTSEDVERKGMITREMLEEYKCNYLTFIKTNLTCFDEDENRNLDVWYLSFKPQ